YISTAFIISVGFVFQRISGAILGWYDKNFASKTVTKMDDQLIPLARRSSKIVIWTIAILLILPLYGINISVLITALGVSSLAIALAAQDTISNIIAGFMIMIDNPFRVRDKIKLPSGEIVEVLDIGIRRTKCLAEDGAIIIVPNLDLSKNKIINFTYGEERKRTAQR
ncbi:MAG: mechanosensitive ion channel family protein, partial [Candidatus Omnitrophica bacterium]|nr:mechanosensitive ion channel family protein [Candidatus Omnitrophota bacterium]